MTDHRKPRGFAIGLLVGVSMHAGLVFAAVLLVLLFSIAAGPYAAFLGVGILLASSTLQLLYMVPAIVRGVRRAEPRYVAGLCCAGILLCVATIGFYVTQELRRPLP